MTRLILASGSAVRAAMLTHAGVPHEIHVAHIDEDAVKEALLAEGVDMRGIADALAELKAVRVSASNPESTCAGRGSGSGVRGRL